MYLPYNDVNFLTEPPSRILHGQPRDLLRSPYAGRVQKADHLPILFSACAKTNHFKK